MWLGLAKEDLGNGLKSTKTRVAVHRDGCDLPKSFPESLSSQLRVFQHVPDLFQEAPSHMSLL